MARGGARNLTIPGQNGRRMATRTRGAPHWLNLPNNSHSYTPRGYTILRPLPVCFVCVMCARVSDYQCVCVVRMHHAVRVVRALWPGVLGCCVVSPDRGLDGVATRCSVCGVGRSVGPVGRGVNPGGERFVHAVCEFNSGPITLQAGRLERP